MSDGSSEKFYSGQVAIVTGAGWRSGGIGRTIARRLAERGVRVAISDVDPSVEKSKAWLETETGGEIHAHLGNLAREDTAAELIDQTMARWGHIDILVNNAGGGIIKPFLDHTGESLIETVDRNLWTTLYCSHRALPHMVERGYGRIVNIGADSVRNGLFNHAAYNAAKGGVHGLTTGLAREFAAHNITVNTVAPCAVNTQRFRDTVEAGSALAAKFLSVIPKGRPAEMEEVAAMVVFLTDPDSAFTTGQVISVNGGSTML